MQHIRNRGIDSVCALHLVAIHLVVVALLHALDQMRLGPDAEVREHRVCGNEVAHRHVIDAKRNRRRVRELAGYSSLMPDVLDAIDSDIRCNTDSGDVEGFFERLAHRDRSAELAVVVLRIPRAVTRELYLERLVLHDARRSDPA